MLWGRFKSDVHFFGTRAEGGYGYLLGGLSGCFGGRAAGVAELTVRR